MDKLNVELLDALQSEGRLTNFELADRIGLSASQCSRRRASLEADGTIASYHAVLSDEALGLDVTAFVQVKLATHSPDNSEQFIALIETLDEVQEAYSLTGEADYLIRLIVPDLKSLSRILNDVFLPHASVAQVRSSIVLDRLKRTTCVPLWHLRTDSQSRKHKTTKAPKSASRGKVPASPVTKRVR